MGAKGGRNMESRKLLDALHTAERLKDATRHCDTSGGRRESVAEHSWRMTLMAYLVSDEFPGLLPGTSRHSRRPMPMSAGRRSCFPTG